MRKRFQVISPRARQLFESFILTIYGGFVGAIFSLISQGIQGSIAFVNIFYYGLLVLGAILLIEFLSYDF